MSPLISGFSSQIALELDEKDPSSAPFSIICIIILWIMLHMFNILESCYSQLLYFIQKLLAIFRPSSESNSPSSTVNGGVGDCANDLKISRADVEGLMEKMQIFYDPRGDKLQDDIGSREIGALFEEEEPRLEEVKEAFGVFDENRDGYIDAAELKRALSSFGCAQLSEIDCKRLIATFDDNGDGLIDFSEFAKIIEKSFQ